jgi:hypothetical protein
MPAKKSPNKRHHVHAASLSRIAKRYRKQAKLYAPSTETRYLWNRLAEIMEEEVAHVRSILR